MAQLVTIFVAFLAYLQFSVPAFAERRVALVIGNDAYSRLSEKDQLRNSINDAKSVGRALESLGFKAIVKFNLRRGELIDALSDFAGRIERDDIAFFFYAGHGVALNGANYILPSDIDPPGGAGRVDEERLIDTALAESRVVERLRGAGARVAVVVLDACRDNPLASSSGRSLGGSRGLASPPEAEGVMSIYSAGVGQIAWDRLGEADKAKNSVFTRVFVDVLRTPGLDLQGVARETRRRVAALARSAGKEQTPGYYEQIDGEIYLAGRKPEADSTPPAAAAASEVNQGAFEAAMSTGTVEALDGFLAKYPSGSLANIARREREKLKTAPNADASAAKPGGGGWWTWGKPAAQQGEQQVVAATPGVTPVAPQPAGPCRGVKLASLGSRSASPLSGDEECALEAKSEFKECEKCPTMVVIPAGKFNMGSPKNEPERGDNEGPQHRVTIVQPFAAGKFTVTFEEWEVCVVEGGCDGYSPKDEGWGRGRMPAINVSWWDAKAYVAWLSKKTGKAYRLLSEAEWEYAARGGTITPFWWGKLISTDQANYSGAYRRRTVPVDNFQPNPFGLYQVHGNVWQWVEDCWHDSYSGAPTDGSGWKTGDCLTRVLRGGSWVNVSRNLRAALRYNGYPDARISDGGFRVARTLIP